MMFVLATLRRIDIHPMNYLMLAGAFFAFHLLFAYTADRLPTEAAFALASAVSILLVVSYLRLVVSQRFAYVEAALAQLVYLVGFSWAHFFEGFTGLSVTVLAVVTLAAVPLRRLSKPSTSPKPKCVARRGPSSPPSGSER